MLAQSAQKTALDQMIQAFIPGYESVCQASFFSRVVLGTPLTANGGTYTYFGDNGGQFKSNTNFPIAGQLPSNMGFVAWAYRYEINTRADIGNVMTAFQDAYFEIDVADYKYKQGHGLELLKLYPGIAQYSTAEIGTSAVALTAPFAFSSSEGATIELLEPIPLTSQVNVSATVTMLTDVAALNGVATKFRLIGTLARKIGG